MQDIPPPFPVSDATMRFYFHHLQEADPPTPYSTISQAISSLAYHFQTNNLPDLTKDSSFREYILSLKRTHKAGLCPNAKSFVTSEMMRDMINQGSFHHEVDSKELCLLTLMFFGFLRVSEVILLNISDIKYEDQLWQINIAQSKTDKFSYGAIVFIDSNKTIYSAFHWLADYFIGFVDKNSSESLFDYSYGQIKKIIRKRLRRIGQTDISKYTSHSFRKGGAHSAAALGIQDCVIQSHGRWKSSCYTIYTSVQRRDAGKTITAQI
jgi:integrase